MALGVLIGSLKNLILSILLIFMLWKPSGILFKMPLDNSQQDGADTCWYSENREEIKYE